jgi:hypothetical protein
VKKSVDELASPSALARKVAICSRVVGACGQNAAGAHPLVIPLARMALMASS